MPGSATRAAVGSSSLIESSFCQPLPASTAPRDATTASGSSIFSPPDISGQNYVNFARRLNCPIYEHHVSAAADTDVTDVELVLQSLPPPFRVLGGQISGTNQKPSSPKNRLNASNRSPGVSREPLFNCPCSARWTPACAGDPEEGEPRMRDRLTVSVTPPARSSGRRRPGWCGACRGFRCGR